MPYTFLVARHFQAGDLQMHCSSCSSAKLTQALHAQPHKHLHLCHKRFSHGLHTTLIAKAAGIALMRCQVLGS